MKLFALVFAQLAYTALSSSPKVSQQWKDECSSKGGVQCSGPSCCPSHCSIDIYSITSCAMGYPYSMNAQPYHHGLKSIK